MSTQKLIKSEILSKVLIKLTFSKEIIREKIIKIYDKNQNSIKINNKEKKSKELFLEIDDIDESLLPYSIVYEGKTEKIRVSFTYLDNQYFYNEDDLGASLNFDGSAILKIWSPLAADIKAIIYDKNNQNEIIANNIQMFKDDKGIWSVILNEKNTGIKNLNNYFYNYKIDSTGVGNYKLALDPYAKSMAAWNNDEYKIGKGAIINPSNLGPKLDYAKISNYTKREDAIIYEIHVRDLTVDPSIENELTNRFGTFKALIDKLPYIKNLGITHIQLLPVMSYFNINELASDKREMNWSSQNSNYNWGYDPHSYFSLTGVYSENPLNPELRIVELKELINAIHEQGMGITLDVVFNHTSNVYILEDLVPEYYHFMDKHGKPKESFGGGRLGTTHAMSRKILVDSIVYFTKEFKVDGFRFDMMGDHDAESIQIAFDEAKKINPNVLMIGEGWRTFVGDDGDLRQAADQDWMAHTESVGVFSDEIRDELKSGYNSEGEPRFITGMKRNIGLIFDNIKAQPHTFVADQPGDVVQYIEAHDNLTLHDVVAQSIKKDPDLFEEEIHRRIRIGNAMVLTAQGTAFLHGGQEYGRTKQWRDPINKPNHKETYMRDKNGKPFKFPYFIHDSYNSSDAVNMFDWEKATNADKYPISTLTKDYTKGLIELRKSSDAFRLGSMDLINENVKLIYPSRDTDDLVISYSCKSSKGEEYFIFINADEKKREFKLSQDLTKASVLVDEKEAGIKNIVNPKGVVVTKDKITLAPLTLVILKM